MNAASVISSFPDLHVCNDVLSDPDACARVWDRNGYWFFRGVLDAEAIAEFRRPVLEELKRIGVVDPDQTEPVWNGHNQSRFPAPTHAGYEPFPALIHNSRWRVFLNDPRIAGFFTRVLGAPANWVPVAELRVIPPWDGRDHNLFSFPHQDGFYNEGYRCLTAWMPLWRAGRSAGGLVVAEGMHLGGYLHDTDKPPRFPIPEGAIPQEVWRTADYEPGDVVIFDRKLPHSGLSNRSANHFRISYDVRCVLPGDEVPVVGFVVSATPDSVIVREESGAERRLRLTEASFCRGLGRNAGERLGLHEVPEVYRPGQEVMVTLEGDCVRLLREPKY
jgi:hypothetical protein